ncbi:MAG: hypothetical protein F6K41_15970 [Symploca sp. SIO3E6]|nr:hypothetical protein [Caldora sp. SIO3E6]
MFVPFVEGGTPPVGRSEETRLRDFETREEEGSILTPIPNSRFPIPNSRFPIPNYPLSTTNGI